MNLLATVLESFTFLAQAATGPTTGTGGGGAAPTGTGSAWDILRTPMFPILLLILVMYVFMFRSKRNQEKQRQDMLGQMKRGDRVQTIGGILGKVVDVEDTKILLKVDESSNTKIWFARSAINRVIAEDKADVK